MAFSINEEYFSGQGICLIGLRGTDGKPLGLRPLGNVPALVLKNAVTTIEHKESQTGLRGIDLRLTTEIKASADITIENFNSANLALTTRGDTAKVVGATVTAAPYNAYPGLVTPFPHIKLSVVSITTAGGTPVTLTPFVSDATAWDYKLNLEAGSVEFNTSTGLDGSGTPPNIVYTSGVAAVLASYTYASHNKINGLTQSAPELYLRFEGLNTAEGNSPVVIEVFKFAPDPTQNLALIGDTVQQMVIIGSVLRDLKQTSGSQYYKITKIDQ